MSINASNDPLAERREARRRRILENMDSRLKKIANPTSPADSPIERPTPAFKETHNGYNSKADPISTNGMPFIENEKDSSDDVFNLLNSNTEMPAEEVHPVVQQFMSRKYFHLLLVALTTVFFLHVKMGYLIYENIFTPFFSLEVVHFIAKVTSPGNSKSSLMATALTLCGINSKVVFSAATIMWYMLEVVTDLCMYVFIFVLCDQWIKLL